MGKQYVNKTIAAAAGTAIADIAFVEGNVSRVVAFLAGAGTSTLEYTVDPETTVRADPVTGITWISLGSGPTSTTPIVVDLAVPITAVRIQPVTEAGTLKIISTY